MGHVLGVWTLWDSPFALVQNPSLPSSPRVDTYFTGTFAIAAFDAAGGTSYTGGNKVPVENLLGVGSGDVHWRESVLMNELMTPVLNGSEPNPLSAITTQSLADLGYTVDSVLRLIRSARRSRVRLDCCTRVRHHSTSAMMPISAAS